MKSLQLVSKTDKTQPQNKSKVKKEQKESEDQANTLGNHSSLEELSQYARQLSGTVGIAEHSQLKDMESYQTKDGENLQKNMDIALSQGYVQIGGSPRKKEIVLSVKKRVTSEQAVYHENERTIHEIRNKSGSKNIVSENKEASLGIKFNQKLTTQKLEQVVSKMNEKKLNHLGEDAFSFFENKSEDEKRQELLSRERSIKAAQLETGGVFNTEKNEINRQMELVNSIKSKKTQKKTQFVTAVSKASKKMENTIGRSLSDDVLDLLKKRLLAEESGKNTEVEEENVLKPVTEINNKAVSKTTGKIREDSE